MTSSIDLMKTDVEAWRGLLRMLSDDELARYGAIVLDQYDAEMKYWWAQALMVLGAAVTVGLVARGFVLFGIGRLGFLALGFSWMLGYWPYRSRKTRALWWGHYAAVLAEQARRASGGVAAELPEPEASVQHGPAVVPAAGPASGHVALAIDLKR